LLFDYHRPNKIKVARIFNSYGPRMHPNDGRRSIPNPHRADRKHLDPARRAAPSSVRGSTSPVVRQAGQRTRGEVPAEGGRRWLRF
jgi:hypothetical protein